MAAFLDVLQEHAPARRPPALWRQTWISCLHIVNKVHHEGACNECNTQRLSDEWRCRPAPEPALTQVATSPGCTLNPSGSAACAAGLPLLASQPQAPATHPGVQPVLQWHPWHCPALAFIGAPRWPALPASWKPPSAPGAVPSRP